MNNTVVRIRFFAAVALAALLAGPVLAVTTSWNTDLSGVYTTPANWDNGVPDSDDTAIFNRGFVGYTVTFPGGTIFEPPVTYAIDYLRVNNNQVNFDWNNSFPLQASPSLSVLNPDVSIVVGENAGEVGILNTTLESLTGAKASIGRAPGANGTLGVVGGTFNMSGGIAIGDSGTGTMNVTAGGRVVSGSGGLGGSEGSAGQTTVSGANSQWTLIKAGGLFGTSGHLSVGRFGVGTLSITAGGAVSNAGASVGGGTLGGPVGTGVATVDGSGSTWTNSEAVSVGNQGSGTLNIMGGGQVTSVDGFIGTFGSFVNPSSSGTVNIDGTGSAWINSGNLTVGGNVGSATLSVSNGGTAAARDLLSIEPLGTAIGDGHLSGNIINRGLVAPGNPLGALHIDSVYIQTAVGKLQIELGGTMQGADFDQLQVTNAMSLNGTLQVALTNGFAPSAGDAFDILDWSSLSGTFDTLELPALAAGLNWDTSQLYTSGVLRVIGDLPGDYNQNGIVGSADYTVWRNTLGSTTNLVADGNSNNVIDAADLQVWKTNFGNTPGNGSRDSGVAVPEPTNLALACAGMIAALFAATRQRSTLRCVVLAITAVSVAANTAISQPITGYSWIDPNGGSYSDQFNWEGLLGDNGVPDSPTELASFDLDATYQVDFTSDVAAAGATVTDGTVTWDFFQTVVPTKSYTVGSLNVDGRGGGAPVLIVRDRDTVTATSTLNVRGGGRLDIGQAAIGSGINTLNVPGDFLVQENGVVNFYENSIFNTGTAPVIVGSDGQINIIENQSIGGSAAFNVNGDLLIDGGVVNKTGAKPFNFGGQAVTVQNGGSFIHDGALRFDLSGSTNITLTVDGAGSAFSQPSNSQGILIGQASGGSATVNVQNGGSFSTGGNSLEDQVRATGQINVLSGSAFSSNAQKLLIRGNVTLMDGVMSAVAIDPEGSGTFNFLGGTLHVDDVFGSLVNQGGTLAPGQSVGSTNVDVHYTQQSAGALDIEIGGVFEGDWDVVRVNGNAIVDGTLKVALVDGFQPVLGNSFAILTTLAGNVGGQFDTELLPISNGLTFDVVYNPKSIVLQVVEAPFLAGDYNQNGFVDAADYTVWRDTLGSTTNLVADGNSNNVIDAADLQVWKTNFGHTGGSGAIAGGSALAAANSPNSAAVPEPIGVVMITMVILGICSMAQAHFGRLRS